MTPIARITPDRSEWANIVVFLVVFAAMTFGMWVVDQITHLSASVTDVAPAALASEKYDR